MIIANTAANWLCIPLRIVTTDNQPINAKNKHNIQHTLEERNARRIRAQKTVMHKLIPWKWDGLSVSTAIHLGNFASNQRRQFPMCNDRGNRFLLDNLAGCYLNEPAS